jgi:hypothetical protein
VLAAGVLPEWLARGDSISVHGLRTEHGMLGYTMKQSGDAVAIRFTARPAVPAGGIEFMSPLERPLRAAEADGRALQVRGGSVRLGAWPEHLILRY